MIATGEFRYDVDFGGGTLSSAGGSPDAYLARYETGSSLGVDQPAERTALSLAAFPNPAPGGVTIRFAIGSAGPVRAAANLSSLTGGTPFRPPRS